MAIFIGCLLIYVSISTFFWLIYDIPWYEKPKNSFILAILMGLIITGIYLIVK